MNGTSRLLRYVVLVTAALVLASCGGGGGGGGGSSAGSSGGGSGGGGGGTTPTTGWTSGVYQAASLFQNFCQTVRTGVDIEGTPFPDKAGTALDEKNWLRSWTHETYLWNTEVADSDPSLGGSRTAYFANLKTFATTSSGKAKDEFHFSEPTADYLARRNSAASASYGAEFVILAATVPRDVRVSFTEPGSPADASVSGVKKLIRGTQILTVNGIDLVNGGTTQAQVDALNAALFPATPGITTTLTVRDPGSSTIRSVSLTSVNLTPKPVNRTRVLPDGSGGKVGYILFNTFSPYSSESDIVNAMQTMKDEGVRDLVLDLRYNGGGLLAVASEVSYMIAGSARTSGKTFEQLRFNAAAGSRNPVTGATNSPTPFYSTGVGFTVTSGTALPALNLGRVFVLTTADTCSASEAVINGLRGVGVTVVQIGAKTCGKPYGFYPEDNCGQTYYTIQFQGVNDIGFGDYADGFTPVNSSDATGIKIPGCAGADDFAHDLGDANETLLRLAMGYVSTNTCPSSGSSSSLSPRIASAASVSSPPLVAPDKWIMETNRDMTMRR